MKNDSLVEEVREARRRISARFGHDVRKLVEHYRERERELKLSGKYKFIEAPADTLSMREEPKPYKP